MRSICSERSKIKLINMTVTPQETSEVVTEITKSMYSVNAHEQEREGIYQQCFYGSTHATYFSYLNNHKFQARFVNTFLLQCISRT